jgi:uncharacterized membrane protein
MKKFIAGFLACAILIFTLLTFGFAEDILNVVLNPYPVYINGFQVEVEGYNINGFTFLKLSDIGKCFDSTTLLNQAEERIEVNSMVNPLEPASKSTVARIEIDKTTGDPIGAEFVEYEKCKEAVKYNDFVYMQISDISKYFGIHIKKIEGYKSKFYKNGKETLFDLNVPNNYIFVDGKLYYNTDTFKDLIGE